jgi:hypothetical protein
MEVKTIELTTEEATIVAQVLRQAPLKGTVETLPYVLQHVVSVIKKLETEVPRGDN